MSSYTRHGLSRKSLFTVFLFEINQIIVFVKITMRWGALGGAVPEVVLVRTIQAHSPSEPPAKNDYMSNLRRRRPTLGEG